MRTVIEGRDMTRGPLTANLVAVAWPIALSFLLQSMHNLVDAFWLGKLGKSALVAPTITMHVVFIGMALAMGLGTGGTTLVSQFRGARRVREMGLAGGQTFLLLGAVGIGIAVMGLILAVPILHALQTPQDAFKETLTYLRWILLGIPFMFSFFVYQGIYTGIGDTIGPLQVNFITVLLNLVLDPILIFGLGPIPRLEVAGAAIATVIARSVASYIGIHRIFHGHRGFKLSRADLHWNRNMATQIGRIGLPIALGQAGTAMGFTLLIGIVNTFGSAVTAAFGIGNRVIHIAMAPTIGLSQANATAVGQNLGSGDFHRASVSVHRSSLLIGIALFPITTLMFFFGNTISMAFIHDAQVIEYGRDLFRITAPSVFAFGFVMVLLGSFQGSGHTVPVMVLNMSRLWCLRIPAAYLLGVHLGWGPAGLWWAMFISNTAIALAAFIWFSRGTWKRSIIHGDGELTGPPVEI